MQAIYSSGTASSKYCGKDPPVYAFKRKNCLVTKRILQPVVEKHSGSSNMMISSAVMAGALLFICRVNM